MTLAGVAQSGADAPEPGEARLLASGAIVQQAAQASGLLALLVVVTVLARRLSVTELGAYGLVASLAGYLLVLRNSVAAAAVRAMAGATVVADRARTFAAAAQLYLRVGAATGVLIALAAFAIAELVLDGQLAEDARIGGLGLGAVTAAGIAASVYLDGLRAERRLVRAALMEIVAVAIWLAIMLALILSGASLAAVIAASGAMPLLSGLLSLVAGAPPAPAVPAAGGLRARPPDRPDRGLAARGRALQPRELRLPARDPRRDPLAHAGGPLRGPAARAQPALRAERRARRAHGAHGVALRGHGRRAPARTRSRCAAAATRSRCSCPSA